MAKTRMVCPFSGRLCEECPLFRGRHYFLFFCKKYRGHLAGSGDTVGRAVSPALELGSTRRFEIPLIKPGKAIDPFDMILKAGKEG